MEIKNKSRRGDIDLLKGISILAVVLYHIGILESGYLGVDVFFVIAGFLTMPKVIHQIADTQFSYIKFIWNRVIRLLPAILIGAAVCLVIGYFFWLPDDYENLSQSIIASSAFANNILSAITTKNYWDSVNDYKPFMHTWYLGILMQFYLAFPIVAIVLKKVAKLIKKNVVKTIYVGFAVLAIVSFGLFLAPGVSTGDRFYLIPFRFYELVLGGLVGAAAAKMKNTSNSYEKGAKCLSIVSLVVIVGLMCIGVFTFDPASIGVESIVIGGRTQTDVLLLPNLVLVPSVVLATAVFLAVSGGATWTNKVRILNAIGERSFSIFVWHQIMLAVYRYSISNKISVLFLILFALVLYVISELSYRLVEKKVTEKHTIAVIVCACLVCAFSGYVYLKSGTMRDVPELGVSASNIQAGAYAKYCDRIYGYDKEFENTDKLNVLVVGNSFARDFGNILLESVYAEEIELSYSFDLNKSLADRMKEADRVFVFDSKRNVPDYLWENVKSEDIVYGIGTKNFGSLNGQIYFNRFDDDYFKQTVALDPGYKEANKSLRNEWGEQYIDMFELVMVGDRVRVFTDNNMYISQDTRHLTEAGARYYAELLDLEQLLY